MLREKAIKVPTPLGKDDITFMMTWVSTVKASGDVCSKEGMSESGDGRGCLALRACRVSLLGSAIASSLQASIINIVFTKSN